MCLFVRVSGIMLVSGSRYAYQVRQPNLYFLDMFSTGHMYQVKPPSGEHSTRSTQRPPPE